MADNPALLPPGFHDLLQNEAKTEMHITRVMTQLFENNGYTYVKPPLMENEHSFSEVHVGKAVAKKMFRLMDPVSKEMLGVRADITSQIVRIALTRLPEAKRPLRLCYASDALRIEATDTRPVRQFTQIGCEIFGFEGTQADTEICVIALQALQKCGIENVTIDFCLPTLVPSILNKLDMPPSVIENVKKAIIRRDIHALQEYKHSDVDMIIDLIKATGTIDDAIATIEGIQIDDAERANVQNLKVMASDIQRSLKALGVDNVTLSLDPVETRGFEYHAGIAFSFFADGAQGVLGRGGRYNAEFRVANGDVLLNECAVGFTFYTDAIRPVVNQNDRKSRLYVSGDVSADVLSKLQGEGYITVRALDDDDFTEDMARQHWCDFIYKDGKPVAVTS